MMLELNLPWPPTVNTYWRNPPGQRPLISKAGRNYRLAVQTYAMINRQDFKHQIPLQGRLYVSIEAYPPDNRQRDLDNILKAVLDSLTKAGIYLDDSQIDRLTVNRAHVAPPGHIVVNITPMER